MKLTILATDNKIQLIKTLRQWNPNMILSVAINIVDSLPQYIPYLSEQEAVELKDKLDPFATTSIDREPDDIAYNVNINPPPEYIAAMEWYETLRELEKHHIEQIIRCRNSPAIC